MRNAITNALGRAAARLGIVRRRNLTAGSSIGSRSSGS